MHRFFGRFAAVRLGIAPIGVQRALRRGDQVDDGIVASIVFLAGGGGIGEEFLFSPAARQSVRQRIHTAAMTQHQARRDIAQGAAQGFLQPDLRGDHQALEARFDGRDAQPPRERDGLRQGSDLPLWQQPGTHYHF